MRYRKGSALVVASLLAISATALAGCDRLPAVIAALTGGSRPASSTTVSGTATTTAEATATDTGSTLGGTTGTTAIEVSHGRIYTPAMGTSLRKRLMDAARSALNTSQQFVVYQLWVQGNVAVGDIKPTASGQRHFVAWVGPGWKVVWAQPYGGSKANAAKLARDVPQASSQLVARLNFHFVPGPDIAALKASARAKTAAWYNGLLRQIPSPHGRAVTTAARVYKDGDGVWWAGVGVQSSNRSLEGTDVIWRRSGGTWHRFSIAGSDGFYPAVPSSVKHGLGYNF